MPVLRRLYMLVSLPMACLLVGCSSPDANCETDGDCAGHQRCIAGGGIFVTGGQCVPSQLLDDARSDTHGADTDNEADAKHGDAGGADTDTGTSDTAISDADASVMDTRRHDLDADGGAPTDSNVPTDAVRDTTPDCSSPAPGCSCAFGDNDVGVCRDGVFDEDLTCRPPESYTDSETACDDGLDNDCDGKTDADDEDCKKGPGASCSADMECRSICVDAKCVHRVFVTSTRHDGNLGGLAGGDQICEDRAEATLNDGGRWRAILSDSTTAARGRLSIDAPVFRLDGKGVADGAADFWDNSLDVPIAVTDMGQTVRRRVWTGTNGDGTRDETDEMGDGDYCDDWRKACGAASCPMIHGEAGDSSERNAGWALDRNDPTCDSELSLYCLEVP